MTILLMLPRPEVHDKIVERLEAGQALLNEPIQNENNYHRVAEAATRWKAYNVDLLRTLFSDDEIAEAFTKAHRFAYVAQPLPQEVESFHRGFEILMTRMRSILDRLELHGEAPTATATSANDPTPVTGEACSSSMGTPVGSRRSLGSSKASAFGQSSSRRRPTAAPQP